MVWACPPPPPPPPTPPPCAVQAAHQWERTLHDRHPRWVHTVETTLDQVEAAMSGRPPAPPGGGDVVVIEIKGKLLDVLPVAPTAHRPRYARYFVLVLDRATCQERAYGIGQAGLRLRPLGQVTTIK